MSRDPFVVPPPTYQCVYVYKSSRMIYLAPYITNATSGPFLCFLLEFSPSYLLTHIITLFTSAGTRICAFFGGYIGAHTSYSFYFPRFFTLTHLAVYSLIPLEVACERCTLRILHG
jgi:hypothetical protein